MGGKGGEGWGEFLPTDFCRSLAFNDPAMHLSKGLGRGLMVSELGGVMCMRMVMHEHLQFKSERRSSSWELEEVTEPR